MGAVVNRFIQRATVTRQNSKGWSPLNTTARKLPLTEKRRRSVTLAEGALTFRSWTQRRPVCEYHRIVAP